MHRVLEIFTFPKAGGYMGGVATMVSAYISGVDPFAMCGYTTELFDPEFTDSKFRLLSKFRYFFFQRRKLKEQLFKEDYQVVHIHTSCRFLFFKDVLLAKYINTKFCLPVVMTIHVGAKETVFRKFEWFEAFAIRILNSHVSAVVFLADQMKEDFIRSGLEESRAHLLYNFHQIECGFDKSNNNIAQLLFVGAIHREKGIIELLTALSEMTTIDFHLNVCGLVTDRSIEKDLEKLAGKLQNKVSFLGYVSGIEKDTLYKRSDILILPSYHEGLPLVIMEALGAGCAIVSTKVGAIPEVLGKQNVCWVEIQSSDDVRRELESLLSSPELLTKMQYDNYELGKAYSFSTHVKKLCSIYDRVRRI